MSKPVSATPESTKTYRERVLPSVASLLPVGLIWPTAYLTFLLINPTVGAIIGGFATLIVLVSIWFAAPVIELDNTGFSVGDTTLPLEVITKATVIEADDAFEERGVRLSPAAYVRFQLSVKQLIRLDISDPQDSTPYWLIATRNPGKIAGLVAELQRG